MGKTALLSRNKSKKESPDSLLNPRLDRRLLANVPDNSGERSNIDRRGHDGPSITSFEKYVSKNKAGVRYHADIQVRAKCWMPYGVERSLTAQGIDISASGMLLKLSGAQQFNIMRDSEKLKLKFHIDAGTMPEGYEMGVKIGAKVVRTFTGEDGDFFCGVEFDWDLSHYAVQHKDKHALTISSLFLFFIVAFIVLMRAESVIYFKFNKILYFYSIVTATFLLSRYLFGSFYRPEPVNLNFTPGVTIIIPCFNEQEWIQRTIVSCVNQDYPIDKLEVIVVDDCSNDRSVEKIQEIIEILHQEGARFKTEERVKYIVQPKNSGKRHALSRGVVEAKHELVVFVDSDSFLDPYAIRNLVMPFQDPKMGGVSGRTDVANTYTNALTKMQSVRYYIAFRIMKAAEAVFDAVTCLSGPLACYRKEYVLENMDEWLNQKFLGRKATFGDDRSMTNFILSKYRTGYQDTAICSTIVPNRYKVFLSQQMRWKRSWLRESMVAGKFMWKKEPFVSILFYIGLLVPVAAPLVVFYNMLYVPIMHRVFPTTFLIGMLLMAMLMSVVQLFLKKSSTWLFGMLFCVFYESVLLWQMPIAWFTFWKSTWGTRDTPEDLAKAKRKNGNKTGNYSDGADVQGGEDDNASVEENRKHRRTRIAKKDRGKKFRGALQGTAVLLAVYFILNALLTTSIYQHYAVVPANSPDNGFIAISYFGVDRDGSSKLISTNQLEQHLKALKESGYVTITQQDVRDYYAGEKTLPPKALLLMFEDGRRDTAIFAQKIMEKYNDLGTVFTYADKFQKEDPKFLSPDDLKKLVDSSYWELGTNGYRLSFINVFDRYDYYLGELSSLEFSMVAPYINRKYDHYLMDYIRDDYGIPKESLEEMRDRISLDYELMNEVYQKEMGSLPSFYALMHSNTGQFGTNDMASRANADNIYKMFAMNVNREGLAFNDKNNSIYDITRLQPQPYWPTNHLLMRLWDDTQQEMAFVTGDEERASLWNVLDGKTEFSKNDIIITSLPSGVGRIRLDSMRRYKNISMSVQLLGNALGSQAILLRADKTLENYISVAVRDKNLVITQVRNGEAEELFSERLDIINGDDLVSVPEDKKQTEIGRLEMQLKYSQNAKKAVNTAEQLKEAQLRETESIDEGAEEFVPNIDFNELQNKVLTLSLSGNELSVSVDGVEAVTGLKVKSSPAGSVLLEARSSSQKYSQRNLTDDVYDGVFRDAVITENDETGDIVLDSRLKAVEKTIDSTQKVWNRVINWFVETL